MHHVPSLAGFPPKALAKQVGHIRLVIQQADFAARVATLRLLGLAAKAK
jgi:hypothetical protein